MRDPPASFGVGNAKENTLANLELEISIMNVFQEGDERGCTAKIGPPLVFLGPQPANQYFD